MRIAYNAANFFMLTAGTTLGTYEILELLGKGGMGEVYRANDRRLKREVQSRSCPTNFVEIPIVLRDSNAKPNFWLR
jgi:serine/threonine protein kinase